MNKSELIEHMAKQADISKAAATRALEALIGGVKSTLKKNGSVSIVGFGTFAVSKRAARSGRNPRTGATIKIKAAGDVKPGRYSLMILTGDKSRFIEQPVKVNIE